MLFFDIVFPAVLIFSTIVFKELLIDCISSVISPISSFDLRIFEKSAFRLPSAISLISLLNDESGRAIAEKICNNNGGGNNANKNKSSNAGNSAYSA